MRMNAKYYIVWPNFIATVADGEEVFGVGKVFAKSLRDRIKQVPRQFKMLRYIVLTDSLCWLTHCVDRLIVRSRWLASVARGCAASATNSKRKICCASFWDGGICFVSRFVQMPCDMHKILTFANSAGRWALSANTTIATMRNILTRNQRMPPLLMQRAARIMKTVQWTRFVEKLCLSQCH